MALTEFETRRIEKIVGEFIESRRPPMHIRKELDLGFRLDGQIVDVFEIRTLPGQPAPHEQPVARARWIKSRNCWNVYWMRADLKWHAYEPEPTVRTIEVFCALVNEDAYACFWG